MKELLKEWQLLTAAERVAIEASDWESFETGQEQKRRLQEHIDGALEKAELGSLQEEWQQLILAEQANADLLGQRMEATRSELNEVNRSSMKLGRIRDAYTSGSQSYWNSYS